MVCIYCGAETHVFNSRPQKRLNQVWRRRRCYSCQSAFSTQEAADYTAAWLVEGKSGALQPFLRDKLFISLYKSCSHRTSALNDAGALSATVINKLLAQADNGVIKRTVIMQIVQVALNRFDRSASVHYQAFHKS